MKPIFALVAVLMLMLAVPQQEVVAQQTKLQHITFNISARDSSGTELDTTIRTGKYIQFAGADSVRLYIWSDDTLNIGVALAEVISSTIMGDSATVVNHTVASANGGVTKVAWAGTKATGTEANLIESFADEFDQIFPLLEVVVTKFDVGNIEGIQNDTTTKVDIYYEIFYSD